MLKINKRTQIIQTLKHTWKQKCRNYFNNKRKTMHAQNNKAYLHDHSDSSASTELFGSSDSSDFKKLCFSHHYLIRVYDKLFMRLCSSPNRRDMVNDEENEWE